MAIPRLSTLALLAPVALAMAPAAGSAQPTANPRGACLLTRNIEGFSAPDHHTVLVRVGVDQIWRLELMTDCLELPYRLSIGLQTTPGEPWVCSPLDAMVIYRQGGIPQRCPVRAIHRLTADERAALPKRDRP